jgi:hypothetical protein
MKCQPPSGAGCGRQGVCECLMPKVECRRRFSCAILISRGATSVFLKAWRHHRPPGRCPRGLKSSVWWRTPPATMVFMQCSCKQLKGVSRPRMCQSGRLEGCGTPQTAFAAPQRPSVPALEGGVPALEGGVPAHEGRVPAHEGRVPAHEGRVPALEGCVPAHEGCVPALEGGVPALEGGVPALEGGVPALEGGVPALEGGVPALEGGVPALEGGVPLQSLSPPQGGRLAQAAFPVENDA